MKLPCRHQYPSETLKPKPFAFNSFSDGKIRLSSPIVVCKSSVNPFALWRDELPKSEKLPGVVPGHRTIATPILSVNEVLARLLRSQNESSAFFSSDIGGITTNRALMSLPIDDDLMSRGLGVKTSFWFYNGFSYLLPQHLEQLLCAATAVGMDRESVDELALKRYALDTMAATNMLTGRIKIWFTGGRSAFSLMDGFPVEAGIYILATSANIDLSSITSKAAVTIRSSSFSATSTLLTKSHADAYAVEKAKAVGDKEHVVLLVGVDDVIIGSPEHAVAAVTPEGSLLVQGTPEGTNNAMLDRLVGLLPTALPSCPIEWRADGIKYGDLLTATEVMVVGTESGVMSLREVDGQKIGDGECGPMTRAIQQVLLEDVSNPVDTDIHLRIPYSYKLPIVTSTEAAEPEKS